jgi:hypothetical protein
LKPHGDIHGETPIQSIDRKVADKMKEYENDGLGYGIFEEVDKDLGLSRGTTWDASGWKDYCDFGFGDPWLFRTLGMHFVLFKNGMNAH